MVPETSVVLICCPVSKAFSALRIIPEIKSRRKYHPNRPTIRIIKLPFIIG
jgi:hypothetical protein